MADQMLEEIILNDLTLVEMFAHPEGATYRITSARAVQDGESDGGDWARGLRLEDAKAQLGAARDWYSDSRIVRE